MMITVIDAVDALNKLRDYFQDWQLVWALKQVLGEERFRSILRKIEEEVRL